MLLASLRSGGSAARPPAFAGPDLLSLEGGGSGEIVSALRESEPDVVVICGVQPGWPHALPKLLARRPRVAIWPMIGEDALLELPGYRDLLEQADVICAIGGAEYRRLRELGRLARSPAIERVQVPIAVDRVAAGHRLPGLTRLSGYVVFLRGFPPGSVEGPAPPRYGRLRRLVPGLAVADVSHQEWRIYGQGSERVVPYPASRTNLWRLMSHALATVDLRPAGLIGREVIESMLLGTPVAAYVRGGFEETVEQSGGGIVFSDEAELVTALRLFLDPQQRERLGEHGRRWAEEQHSDQQRFAAAVRGAVLGPDYE
jgi:glycosyltransferase involved in cell wall biosynthesis